MPEGSSDSTRLSSGTGQCEKRQSEDCYYGAMKKRVAELREIERYKRETEQKWEDRITGFILGLIVALIIIVLRKYLFSS
jgi:hypothetical protein